MHKQTATLLQVIFCTSLSPTRAEQTLAIFLFLVWQGYQNVDQTGASEAWKWDVSFSVVVSAIFCAFASFLKEPDLNEQQMETKEQY